MLGRPAPSAPPAQSSAANLKRALAAAVLLALGVLSQVYFREAVSEFFELIIFIYGAGVAVFLGLIYLDGPISQEHVGKGTTPSRRRVLSTGLCMVLFGVWLAVLAILRGFILPLIGLALLGVVGMMVGRLGLLFLAASAVAVGLGLYTIFASFTDLPIFEGLLAALFLFMLPLCSMLLAISLIHRTRPSAFASLGVLHRFGLALGSVVLGTGYIHMIHGMSSDTLGYPASLIGFQALFGLGPFAATYLVLRRARPAQAAPVVAAAQAPPTREEVPGGPGGRAVTPRRMFVAMLVLLAGVSLGAWLLASERGSVSEGGIPNVTLVREGVELTYSPASPMPGETVTFKVRLEGDLAELAEREEEKRSPAEREHVTGPAWQCELNVWWVPLDQTAYTEGRTSSMQSPDFVQTWTAPGAPGVAVYAAYVKIERTDSEGFHVEDIMAISDIGIIPIPGDAPHVADSPMLQVAAENTGGYRYPPFARIVARIGKKGSEPIMTRLTGRATSRVKGVYREPKLTSSWEDDSDTGCSEFVPNGTQGDDWAIYVSEPEPHGPSNMRRGNGSGIVVCLVAGWDCNGTIHIARPLIFSPRLSIQEEPSTEPEASLCTREGPTVRILDLGYLPRDLRPGENITFWVSSDQPALFGVNWEWFDPGGMPEGVMGAGIQRPFRSPEMPTVGAYQVHVHSNATWTVSRFHPITVPPRPIVRDSSLISLEVSDVGEGGIPYARVEATADKSITNVHLVYVGLRRCDAAGPIGCQGMEKKKGKWVLPQYDQPSSPYADQFRPQNAIIFVQAIGIDQDGVAHYSPTLNYTLGNPGPVVFGP